MAGEIGQGIFGGAVSGAAAGAPLGPWGMGAGALIGGASGLMQGKNAKRLDRQYRDAENRVMTEDPGQAAFLQRLRQQERNMRAGTDASSAFAARNAANVGATTQANLLRAGGPGTVSNLLRAQSGTGNAFAQIGAAASQGANQMLGLQGGIINQIAERKFQRQRELRNQALERSVSARQNLQNMFSGALAMVPGMTANFAGGMGGPKTPPSTRFGQTSYAPGFMLNGVYRPGVFTGLPSSSANLGTGVQTQPPNYGLMPTAPARPNYGFTY